METSPSGAGVAEGPARGLAAVDALSTEPELAGYGYLPAARAEFLRRLGRYDEAVTAYSDAIALTGNQVERCHLMDRRAGWLDWDTPSTSHAPAPVATASAGSGAGISPLLRHRLTRARVHHARSWPCCWA